MTSSWKGRLEAIEGIGSVYAEELRKSGVGSIQSLLKQGGTKAGRRDMAKVTGLSEKRILEWVNRADLIRVKGVGEQYAELLEESGVDTVIELAQRNPKKLHLSLAETNARCHLVHKLPTERQVQGWVKYAKSLKRMVEY